MTYEYAHLTRYTNEYDLYTAGSNIPRTFQANSVLIPLNTLGSEGWRVIKIEDSRWWLEREIPSNGSIKVNGSGTMGKNIFISDTLNNSSPGCPNKIKNICDNNYNCITCK